MQQSVTWREIKTMQLNEMILAIREAIPQTYQTWVSLTVVWEAGEHTIFAFSTMYAKFTVSVNCVTGKPHLLQESEIY